jgi:hypothetical protein
MTNTKQHPLEQVHHRPQRGHQPRQRNHRRVAHFIGKRGAQYKTYRTATASNFQFIAATGKMASIEGNQPTAGQPDRRLTTSGGGYGSRPPTTHERDNNDHHR